MSCEIGATDFLIDLITFFTYLLFILYLFILSLFELTNLLSILTVNSLTQRQHFSQPDKQNSVQIQMPLGTTGCRLI